MTFDLTHRRIRAEATRLAGGPHDVAQRVATYRQLYQQSGRNHVFPLIAAHGAIWGEAFIRRGRVLGHALAQCAGRDSARRIAAVDRLGRDFLMINRRVFIEVYTSYHLVACCGEDPELETHLPRPLITAIAASQAASAQGESLITDQKRELYQRFFGWEQHAIVGQAVTDAVARLDWPMVQWLAMKPVLRLGYFGAFDWLWFRRFDSTAERIALGQRSFEIANRVGWSRVEALLPSDQCDAGAVSYAAVAVTS